MYRGFLAFLALPFVWLNGQFRSSKMLRPLRQSLYRMTPKGLYTRSLLIIIVPMFLLQSVVAYIFMERHWNIVTQRLSASVVSDIGAMIDVYNSYPQDSSGQTISRIARNNLHLTIELLPLGDLPPALPKPFFSLLDTALSNELQSQIGKPFWIDTVGRSSIVEIRVQLDHAILRVYAPRSQTYASNSHIFIVWMMVAAAVLLTVAILFLRNQIKPILTLAHAADDFGKGRDVPLFKARGAREVRQAAQAFQLMKRRIEKQIEQRMTMLNGVSHDLRTILTRFKLQLALLDNTVERSALARDVDDMQKMLEAYLAFARGDAGEQPVATDISSMLQTVADSYRSETKTIDCLFSGDSFVMLRPQSFKRCIENLLVNAVRFATHITLTGVHKDGFLTVIVDDNGPGIPEHSREDVFRPFFRLDDARNQDESSTGLGLAIAKDIATSHGGDIALTDSTSGGLRAVVKIPG